MKRSKTSIKSILTGCLAGILVVFLIVRHHPRNTEAAFSPAEYVNPFIGASTNIDAAGAYHGLGKTFPGAATPFGMVQCSPNTVSGGDNGSGYSYEHLTIEGFALTQMSGVGWYGELGNFLVMPTTGPLQVIAGKEDGSIDGYRSHYDKESETARAGYYSVFLTDYGIKAETSATPRCGIMRFTYPECDTSRIQIDLARRVGGSSATQYVRIVNDSTIAGWMHCPPDCGGWGNGDGNVDYTLHFYARFSRPMQDYGFWSADIPDGTRRRLGEVNSPEYLANVARAGILHGQKEITGKHIGFFTEFPTSEGETIDVKVGISFVDMEGAEKNFMAEIDSKDFETVKDDAFAMWNDALARVSVKGGSDDEKTVFYTALYHTMIDPRICADTDGRFMAADKSVGTESRYTRRTVFSGWDVFRSQFPLQNIINPLMVSDEINSLISLAEESGRKYYERWELLNAYSGCMIGNPALPVIADAYAKGIRTFDAAKALEYAVNTSLTFGTGDLGYTPEPHQSISSTLEYAYADWCAGRLAHALGDEEAAKDFDHKAEAYRNVFDTEAGWFRPRNADGSWAGWNPEKSRTQEGLGCIESNPYQQGWFVPHDIDGMTGLMGGRDKVIADLDYMFDHTPDDMKWNDYYNHANEPVHFVPFIYNRVGAPWRTQQRTRFICDHAYSNRVEGLVGNEDVGQMSAWYVLAASGIHPSCPGDNRMEITSPVFDEVEFRLDPAYYTGGSFKIVARGNSKENIYIDHALLNGKEYNKCYLDFSDISNGGVLELFMTAEPNKSWGIE